MMDRQKLGFWTRIGAVALVILFLGSFLFMGLGTGLNINIADLFHGNSGQQQQGGHTVSTQDQIRYAKQNLKQNPKDPKAIISLAFAYTQNNQLGKAEEVLKKGRKKTPKDARITFFLGQIYAQQAQTAPTKQKKDLYNKAENAFGNSIDQAGRNSQLLMGIGQSIAQQAQTVPKDQQKALYDKAGDAFAAATKADPKDSQAYLAAGQAYDQAGQPGLAVKYWNGYLKLNPKGKKADEVRKRISSLLHGGKTQP